MQEQSLFDLMRRRRSMMASKGKRVVDYLLSNTREAAFLSIGDVAQQLQVSKAQLVRVARMLGFDGYSSLKTALQEAVLEQVNPVAMLNRISRESNESLITRIYETEAANLKDTWAQLREDHLKRWCELIPQARNLYCAGWGISSISAECLYSRLRELGLPGHQMRNDCLTLIEQARALRQGDLLIAFDLPGYSLRLTEAVERAQAGGAGVVTVTDSAAAPICRNADLSFYVSDTSPTFGSSLLSSVFLVHLLTSTLSVSMGTAARTALAEQAEVLSDDRVYHPAFGLRY